MKQYEVNTGALVASPQKTENWVPCEILSKNAVGQLYIKSERGDMLYVFPSMVREVKR